MAPITHFVSLERQLWDHKSVTRFLTCCNFNLITGAFNPDFSTLGDGMCSRAKMWLLPLPSNFTTWPILGLNT